MLDFPFSFAEEIVQRALHEDLGDAGDITTKSLVTTPQRKVAKFTARQEGVVAGLECARLAFAKLDPTVEFTVHKTDGSLVGPQDVIAEVAADVSALLSAERVALNFLIRLSGIATLTHQFVAQVQGHKARITDTRKTTPTLRALEKYAVRAGGGYNHRFGLYDAVMIKDNHIAAVGSVGEAVAQSRQKLGPMIKIEVEVENIEQLDQALQAKADIILLDNMSPDLLAACVKKIDGRAIAEASGGVTMETVRAIAASGVDVISIGALTHSAIGLDIGLDF